MTVDIVLTKSEIPERGQETILTEELFQILEEREVAQVKMSSEDTARLQELRQAKTPRDQNFFVAARGERLSRRCPQQSMNVIVHLANKACRSPCKCLHFRPLTYPAKALIELFTVKTSLSYHRIRLFATPQQHQLSLKCEGKG